MFTKKEFELLIRQLLSIEDFKLVQEIGGYELLKKESDRLLRITLGYRKYPGVFYFRIPFASISFTHLENIYQKFCILYELNNAPNTTIFSQFHPLPGIDYTKFETPLKDRESVVLVVNEIHKIFQQGVFPFFERFRTLEDVNAEINKMTDKEISTFIPNRASLKIPLIKKLILAPDFETELKKSKKFYEGEALKYPQYFKDEDKLFFDLFSDDIAAIKNH